MPLGKLLTYPTNFGIAALEPRLGLSNTIEALARNLGPVQAWGFSPMK